MASIPSAVLSDRLKEVIGTRRLVSGVFLTFKFDPAFFEQEVVPVLLDVPLSHASVIRLVQLEDILRDSPGEIAVYYDVNGLVASDEGSAKLDIRRVPVRLRTGIFHAKNVFLLVEDERPSEGKSLRSLLVASLSANLTRAGWWENVESAHIEEIEAGSKSRLKDDLVQFLTDLRRRAGSAASQHGAVIRYWTSCARRSSSALNVQPGIVCTPTSTLVESPLTSSSKAWSAIAFAAPTWKSSRRTLTMPASVIR